MKISIIKSVCIAVLFISSQLAYAQAPGLMGKRTIIYYSHSVSPSPFGYIIPYNYSEKSELGIRNYIRGYHQVTLEYATSRNRSWNVHYLTHRGGYGINYESVQANYDNASNRNYISQSIAISTKKYRVRLNGYSLSLKFLSCL